MRRSRCRDRQLAACLWQRRGGCRAPILPGCSHASWRGAAGAPLRHPRYFEPPTGPLSPPLSDIMISRGSFYNASGGPRDRQDRRIGVVAAAGAQAEQRPQQALGGGLGPLVVAQRPAAALVGED